MPFGPDLNGKTSTTTPKMTRNTLTQRISSTGNQIEELNPSVLFKMADKDSDGTLSLEEFVKIQEAVKERIYAHLAREVELETKNTRMRRQMFWLAGVALLMAILLGLSVTATAIVVYRTVDKQVAVKTALADSSNGVLGENVPSVEVDLTIHRDG